MVKMTPNEIFVIMASFTKLVNKHKSIIGNFVDNYETIAEKILRLINKFPHTLSNKMYRHLKQFPFCIEFIHKMKRKQTNKISIPFCTEIFIRFIHSDCVKQLYLCNKFKKRKEQYNLLCAYYHRKIKRMIPDKYCVTLVEYEMLHDDEFAWACFYDLDVFQQFSLFIDYKNNYLLRKERLLIVHEELYNNYEHNNAINMVFADDFLVRTVMRVL